MPYLETNAKASFVNEFIDVLSQVQILMEENPNCDYLIAGDFNFEYGSNHPFQSCMNKFCERFLLEPCDRFVGQIRNKYTFF